MNLSSRDENFFETFQKTIWKPENLILKNFFHSSDFNIIIHNVKSKTDYERYQVVVARRELSDSPINLSDLVLPMVPIELNSVFRHVDLLRNPTRRQITYRTRFEATIEQNAQIRELLGGHNEYSSLTPAEWRRYVYDRNLYALPLPNGQGMYRECSAEFYR